MYFYIKNHIILAAYRAQTGQHTRDNENRPDGAHTKWSQAFEAWKDVSYVLEIKHALVDWAQVLSKH